MSNLDLVRKLRATLVELDRVSLQLRQTDLSSELEVFLALRELVNEQIEVPFYENTDHPTHPTR